jgi:4'-phosphopantetheinyl transferase
VTTSLDTSVSSNLRSCLRQGEVKVWIARIDDERMTARYAELLDEDERARAARFVFERDRIRFVQSHGITRLILGNVAKTEASELKFSRGPQGKPRLEMLLSQNVPEFSLSHSGDYCAVAVAQDAVGIDLEEIRDVPQMSDIARLHFTPAEFRQIAALSGVARREAFFAAWTRKEAVAKAFGCGLVGNAEQVVLKTDTEGRSLRECAEFGPITTMRLQSLPGYAVAVVCLASTVNLDEQVWEPASGSFG